jgi:hypothetical protein
MTKWELEYLTKTQIWNHEIHNSEFKIHKEARHQWLIILAVWEAEIRKIEV